MESMRPCHASTRFMDREDEYELAFASLSADQQGLVDSIQHILKTPLPPNHSGATSPNVDLAYREANSHSVDLGPEVLSLDEQFCPLDSNNDQMCDYARYIVVNDSSRIKKQAPFRTLRSNTRHEYRLSSLDSNKTTTTSTYSTVTGDPDIDAISSPRQALALIVDDIFRQGPQSDFHERPSLAQISRAATPEPRPNHIRLHSSKGLICDAKSPLSGSVLDYDKDSRYHSIEETAREQENPLAFRHHIKNQYIEPLLELPGWSGTGIEFGLIPRPLRCSSAADPAFVPKADRILGETSYSRSRLPLSQSMSLTPMLPVGQEALAPQVLASPLPRLTRRSRVLREDIENFVASPTLTQRIKVNGNGRIVSFSVVGTNRDLEGHPVFLFPGVGYTRFVATFLLETATVAALQLITIDGPGQGLSEKLAAGVNSDTVSVLNAVAEALSITRFSLLAYGTGAMEAIEIASHLGDRIVGPVTLLSPFFFKSQLPVKSSTQRSSRIGILEKMSPVKACLLATKLHDVLPCRPASLSDWSSLKQQDRPDEHDKPLGETLWQVSTFPTNPRYLLKTQFDSLPQRLFTGLSAEFRIVHQADDRRKPIQIARDLNDLLPNCSLIVLPSATDDKVDLLMNPMVMADVLESLRRRLNHTIA